jgi:hypothetical protein
VQISSDVIIRSIPESKGLSRKSRFSRFGTGLIVMTIASVSLLTGFAFTPSGTAATSVAFAQEDEGGWDGFLGSIVDTFNPCMNPKDTERPSAREYGGDLRNIGSGSDYYTAYEWYGSGATNSWENYTWKDFEGGCYLTLQGFNVIPNLMLSTQNNIATGVVIPSISWISGINLIDLFFLNPESVVQQMVEELNRVFYSQYLIIVIMLSALSVLWVGVVKRQYRNGLTDVIWIVLATAAGTFFLTNPTLIAGWLDKGVYAVQTTIISSATQAGTFTSDSRCLVNNPSADFPISSEIRSMQCSLWDSFVFQPWADGQMGKIASNGMEVPGASATFRGSNEAALLLLDIRTYNREDVSSGSTTNENKKTLDDSKQAQWDLLAKEIRNNPAAEVGYPYWTGEAWVERITIATGAGVAKIFAFVPVVWLSFGMLGQQIVFVILMIVAPFFLLAGIFPAARRFALGWLEMVLSTAVKRIVYAVLIGILFLWFAAVSSTEIPEGILGTIVGINIQVLLMAIGAVAIMLVQRKAIKKAGDAIQLGGQRITDGGRAREFMSMTTGAVAAGFGAKSDGGSFGEGFSREMAPVVSQNRIVRQFNAGKRPAGSDNKDKFTQQLKDVDLNGSLTDSASATGEGGQSTTIPRPSSTPNQIKETQGSVTTVQLPVIAPSTGDSGSPRPRAKGEPNPPGNNTVNVSASRPVTDTRSTAPIRESLEKSTLLEQPLSTSDSASPIRPRDGERLRRSSEQNMDEVINDSAPVITESDSKTTENESRPKRPSVIEPEIVLTNDFAVQTSRGETKSTGASPSSRPIRPQNKKDQG